MVNSRDTKDLHPKVAGLCHRFIEDCAAVGVDVLVTSTYRDLESQAALYAQGRTHPGKKVTNAPAGRSFHNWRVAFDFVPIVKGKAQWEDPKLFLRCGHIAEQIGLEWAGRWVGFRELAHCQFTGGFNLDDFNSGRGVL